MRRFHHHEHCAAVMSEGRASYNTTHVCIKSPIHQGRHECACGAEWAYKVIKKIPSNPIINFDPGCA